MDKAIDADTDHSSCHLDLSVVLHVYANRTCPTRNASKKKVHMAKKHIALTEFVSKPCFNMDTSNKIRVVPQSTFRITRTDSGGVRDPSDPKHYPALGGTEGAVGTAASQRTLSTQGSFKDTLVSAEMPKLRIGTEGSFGAAPSSEQQRTASPKIPANRGDQRDELVQGGLGGAADVGSPTPSQQVSEICDKLS